MAADPPDEESRGNRFDYRQVSLVLLAAIALVLAAFFAPGLAGDGTGPADPTDETDETGPDGGDGPDVSFDWDGLLDWLDIGGGDDGQPVEPADDGDREGCTIVLNREPVPGDEVTATISYQGEPLDGVPVRFNDRSVGETNSNGEVTGAVPYVEELVVAVGAEGDLHCRAEGPGAASLAPSSGVPTAMAPLTATAGSRLLETVEPTTPQGSVTVTDSTAGVAPEIENSSAAYEVDGEVDIETLDDPYPGETIEIRASIEEVAMRGATVAVDGESVAETDETGAATIAVPDDGTEQLDVRVTRGEFAGTVPIDVLLLEARLVPSGVAPVPGTDGVVVAEIGGEPVPNAVVTIDGEQRGTTDGDGQLPVELPTDPTTTVTVSTMDQTATVTLLGAYGGVAVLLSAIVAGACGVAYRTHGTRGSIAVLGLAVGLAIVLVVEAVYGRTAGTVALAVVMIGAVAAVQGGRVRSATIFGRRRGLGAWLVDRALALVGVLERGIDRFRTIAAAVWAWLASLPRSVTGLGAWLVGWLRSLPEWMGAAIKRTRDRFRGRSIGALAVLGGVTVLAAGYVVGGRDGALLAGAVLAAVAVAIRLQRRKDGTASGSMAAESNVRTNAAGSTYEASSFRNLWRSFARQVAPSRWRTATPGEIERRAIDTGYPREPVCELTTLFRAVEYGETQLSADVEERAEAIVRELRRSTSASVEEALDDPVPEPQPDGETE